MLQKLYASACLSPYIQTRNAVMQTLELLTEPHPTRIERGWSRNLCWVSGSNYFHIHAKNVGNLTMDLQRIRWIEELRLVRLFCFFGTHPSSTVRVGGQEISQNRWVYDKVTSIIPADRVAVIDRNCRLSGSGITYGLPQLPVVYRELETLSISPYFTYIQACDFHGYTELDYSPLSEEEYNPDNFLTLSEGEGENDWDYTPATPVHPDPIVIEDSDIGEGPKGL